MRSAALKRSVSRILALGMLLTGSSCVREEKFPDLGDKVVSPTDVAVSSDGSRFYVLNSDFDRTYNTGSVLVLDADGNKIGAVKVPRMGRSLTLAGNDLLVTVDYGDEDAGAKAILFNVEGAAKDLPVEVKRWDLPCSPYNAVIRDGYPYFALTCLDGSLFVGELTADRAASTLDRVRRFGAVRRALHIDPVRNLLMGFTTDPSKQTVGDGEFQDITSYNDDGETLTDGKQTPNEIPDVWEETRRARGSRSQRNIYQFYVYDLAAEKANAPGCTATETEDCRFPFRDGFDTVAQSELRWIYFKVANFDGTPDGSEHANDPTFKYYRTNFYEARPDPKDPDVFYLSHRGPAKRSPHANQIVRVRITGDLRPAGDGTPPKTGNVMAFDRVYGFKGDELSTESYPGDFDVVDIAGESVLIVNHFRDLVNWTRSETYFSIGAKTLGDNLWFAKIDGALRSSDVTTYYQVATAPSGRAVSCSFYGNAVLLLDVVPGVGITQLKRIE